MEVISNHECKKSFGAERIHETTLCAVGASRGSGTCQVSFFPSRCTLTIMICLVEFDLSERFISLQGDSGSALQYAIDIGRWVQIGVVSFGPATGCQNDYPSGYSKIAHYLDWISQVTGIPLQ